MTPTRESAEAFLLELADPQRTPTGTLDLLTRACARRRHRASYRICREAGMRREGPWDRRSLWPALEWVNLDVIDDIFNQHDRRVAVCNTAPLRPPSPPPGWADRPVRAGLFPPTKARSDMPVPDFNSPPVKPWYAPGSRDEAALRAKHEFKVQQTMLTQAAIRGYLEACVTEPHLREFAMHLLAVNQHWAGSSMYSVTRPDHRQIATMRAEIDELIPRHAPALQAAVRELTDSHIEQLIPWPKNMGYLGPEHKLGDVPEPLAKLPAVVAWCQDFRLTLSAYADNWCQADRLNVLNWCVHGPPSAWSTSSSFVADPHPVLRRWTHAVNAAQQIPEWVTSATDWSNAWQII